MSRAVCKEFGRGGRGYLVPDREYGMLFGLLLALDTALSNSADGPPVSLMIDRKEARLLGAELRLVMRQYISDLHRSALAEDGAR